jgi:site-specific DNA recombinase
MSLSILPNGKPQRQASTAQPPGLLPAAIYARVSTTDQADKGYSLPTQIDACQRLAQQEGYAVPDTHVFVDDYTGTSLNRPQFTKLRDLVHQRLVQAVIVYDLDRLSRKLAHQLLLSEEFEQAGVALLFVTMPTTAKTPETQLLSNVRGIIAEYERSKILERTMRGLRGRAQAGHVPGGAVPLGYRYVRNEHGKTYEIDPEEATLVQHIFEMYTKEGLSINAIAQHLTRAGVPTHRDRRGIGPARKLNAGVWHPASLHDLLTSETYIGTLYYGKTERISSATNPDKKTTYCRPRRAHGCCRRCGRVLPVAQCSPGGSAASRRCSR